MANRLIWEDRFNIGVDQIDKEHKKLFQIVNKLFVFSEQKEKGPWVCQEGIKYFKDHAVKHFAEEEAYMAAISYPGLEMHRHLHQDFSRHTLPALEKELERTGYAKDAIQHFLSVCAGWLIGHTLTEDRAIVGKEQSKWVNLMPEEEQFVVMQTILRQLHEMFQLDTEVVSECYGGERFGSGVYFRLIYGDRKGRQREIFVIYEEKVLVGTVGKLIGASAGKLDAMILNAARFTTRQFVESIRKRFPSTQDYQLESENLLTYEQFERAFGRQLPQYSLLFDTGAGYFAYCAMTPQTKRKQGAQQQEEHTATDIEKYLTRNERENSSQKKKLLVVDDSDTVQLAMKGLLQEDYQITAVHSGAAAIRSISLERPDLVLLDYDMPVCDGAQVLQMIRSEAEFADIPVFFLTGRVDKASVSKVIPLKPEGYLLKSENPGEIKKKIDRYFERKQGKSKHANAI